MSFFERLEFLQKFWNYEVSADILGYAPSTPRNTGLKMQ
ncbi:hypothetical protein H0A61_00246 [Koleobacter methoxysyntrophicus]|uniref:Uncharacterized protein n=1 Tax=Koleobacter methoxysyntrophicus TaxID=2751313 RepID=A0A8A0RKA2_9FIRM|nr:hypothetical protein H0A61_00246 [Koleobacter methoxysyntrophicus]